MSDPTTTGRITGAWYLGLAVTGVLGFLVVRPALYVAGDPAATLANLAEREGLAATGVVLEMSIVLTQALAALWFYKLLRPVHAVAAFGAAAFGIANAIAIMASGGFVATAVAVAGDPTLAPGGDAAATVGLLYELSANAWGMGNLFFGLWLIPMGWVAVSTGRFPRSLGWLLIVAGAGYVVSGLLQYGLPEAPRIALDALTFPATVAEFWLIGYLLWRGIRAESPARERLTAD